MPAFVLCIRAQGLGMLSEAYIVFSAGQIQPLQQAMYPRCFNRNADLITECNPDMVQHVASYVSHATTHSSHIQAAH